jgi:hypothetical protein
MSERWQPSPARDSSARRAPYCPPSSTSHDSVLLPCPRLFEHLVRPEAEHRGKGQAECLRSLEVEHQLEPHGLLRRQLGRPDTLEDLVRKLGDAPPLIRQPRPIRDQPPGFRILPPIERRRQPVPDRELGELSALAQEHRVGELDEGASALPGHRQKRGLELAGVVHLDNLQLHA